LRLCDLTLSAYRARSGPTGGLSLQLCNVNTASCRCVSQLIWQAFDAPSSRIAAAPLTYDTRRWTVAGKSARVVRAHALAVNLKPGVFDYCRHPSCTSHTPHRPSYPFTLQHRFGKDLLAPAKVATFTPLLPPRRFRVPLSCAAFAVQCECCAHNMCNVVQSPEPLSSVDIRHYSR